MYVPYAGKLPLNFFSPLKGLQTRWKATQRLQRIKKYRKRKAVHPAPSSPERFYVTAFLDI
ncbi:hypothetical protein V9K67_07110 [Paraflavisolibacter sp. H34]|uniref:hypothetical protein n=1 Tax=Huijunlia imazamoxiresistens TaxID=3127457 RepID=UPI003018A024